MASTSLLRGLTIFFAVHVQCSFAQHERPAASSSSSNATCPARTVNYITHTLPQLCLTSSRAIHTDIGSVETGTSYSLHSSDHASAAPHKSPLSEQSSTTSTLSVTLTPSPTASKQVLEVPSQSPADFETKTENDESDQDSDLANANFLSFQDWKRKNLAKSGQSEHVGKVHQNNVREPRRKPLPVSDTLDSLGDDAEIDLDFAGFAAERPDIAAPSPGPKIKLDGEGTDKEEAIAHSNSRDAGTTSKERFNYASFDCAATVLKTNPEAKGAATVLSENKDSYMLNECSAENKFLIVELCNDISIDTIVLANFEFFSSIFRTFRVSISDRYPVKADKWKTLGTFEGRNSREVQAFPVENPLIWARYLRIEFLTHYGSEYYCPVSLLRIHGTTMMEEYKHDLEASRADGDEDEEEEASNPVDDLEPLIPKAAGEGLLQEEEVGNQAIIQEQTADIAAESQPSNAVEQTQTAKSPFSAMVDIEICPYNKTTEDIREMAAAFNKSQPTCSASECTGRPVVRNETAHNSTQERTGSVHSPLLAENTVLDGLPLVASNTSSGTTAGSLVRGSDPVTNSTLIKNVEADPQTSPPSSGSIATKSTNVTNVDHSKTSASLTHPSPASPTIQESFFRSVQKRLQMLESNSSLSLQYIEEQSRNLRDAFSRVEQRQLSKTTTFLDYLNSTVLSELREFRLQYDQLWQSTVIELEIQREQYQKEVLAINSRLAILAEEVVFQKRMSMMQSILVLMCLGLVLFSRGAMNNYLELPIVQNMLARSPSLRRLNSQILQTPTESPATTRPSSSHKQNPPYGILKNHRSQDSEDVIARDPSPSAVHSPSTPTSIDESSHVEEVKELSGLEGPMLGRDIIMRPSSSPPVLADTEDTRAGNWHVPDTVAPATMNGTVAELLTPQAPRVTVEEATPPAKHLSFRLPDS